MQTMAIIGSQWGDEGKGKITDLISKECQYVVRFQGGNNAGHTIIVGDQKIVLHLIPSGILHEHCVSLVGHGVVFDPSAFKEELAKVVAAGVKISPNNLKVSEHCTVITAYNKILDGIRESQGTVKIGTTGKGIGPAYEDKVARRAIKLKDLLDKKCLKEKLAGNLREKEALFTHLYKAEFPTLDEETERLFALGQEIAPFLSDTFTIIDRAHEKGDKILYEGAQGVLLDIDYGSYPFVTSSHTSMGGIFTGAGIPGGRIDESLGITKAYTTRVGEGPFPTELRSAIGEKIQTVGNEFGATTGRKRRCGWLDLPLLKYSVKASNLTSLALTKLDVLSGLEELKVCTSYKVGDQTINCAYPGLDLERVEPVFESMKPFQDKFESNDLSNELGDYIEKIEKELSIPVGILAYGPERSQILFRKDYF